MFTGIVEEIGKILSIKEQEICIEAKKVLENTKAGDSIAVNGVCLTVRKILKSAFSADISPETYRVTSFSQQKTGSYVNLERAMLLHGRFGGHIVTGHIDGVGKIKSLKNDGDCYELEVLLEESDLKYVVKKGSITINGISLTIAEIRKNAVTIAVIPHTYENTSLKYLKIGEAINIETDILAKYVEKFLSTKDNKSGISIDFLKENGF